MIENTSGEYTEVLHVSFRIAHLWYNQPAETTQHGSQHTISKMYIEGYWLLYSNRENTWNGLRGSKYGKPSLK